jgi:hypothetical protein
MDHYKQLPSLQRNYRGEVFNIRGIQPECLIYSTAHVVDASLMKDRKSRCHCCGKWFSVYVVVPGSPYAWCVACF